MPVSEHLRTYPSPTPQQSADNKLGLTLGLGRGMCAVVQILTAIHHLRILNSLYCWKYLDFGFP